jgi:hypothetical protein
MREEEGKRGGRGARAKARCGVRGCGRAIYAAGHCQTHYRQQLATGELRPIRLYRKRMEGTVKLGGLRLSPGCAEKLEREAEAKGLSISATIADILEGWHAGG